MQDDLSILAYHRSIIKSVIIKPVSEMSAWLEKGEIIVASVVLRGDFSSFACLKGRKFHLTRSRTVSKVTFMPCSPTFKSPSCLFWPISEISWWYQSGIRVISEWCQSDVRVMPEWWQSDDRVMTEWCQSDVRVMSEWCQSDVRVISEWYQRDISDIRVISEWCQSYVRVMSEWYLGDIWVISGWYQSNIRVILKWYHDYVNGNLADLMLRVFNIACVKCFNDKLFRQFCSCESKKVKNRI